MHRPHDGRRRLLAVEFGLKEEEQGKKEDAIEVLDKEAAAALRATKARDAKIKKAVAGAALMQAEERIRVRLRGRCTGTT